MNTDALSDFHLLAMHMGFGSAARASGRPKSSISKHVRSLEQELGVALLAREGRTIALTEEGRKLAELAGTMLGAVNEYRADISQRSVQPSGRLKIATPSLFGQLWVGKVVADFLKLYPRIELEIVTFDEIPDLSKEFCDLIIQANPPQDLDFIGRIIGRDSVRVVTSPAFLEAWLRRSGEGADTDVPAVAPLHTKTVGPWSVRIAGRAMSLEPRIVLSLPSRTVIRDAVCEGFGFAELPAFFIQDLVARRALVDLGAAPHPEVEIWALYPSKRLLSPRVSSFVSFVAAYLKATGLAP